MKQISLALAAIFLAGGTAIGSVDKANGKEAGLITTMISGIPHSQFFGLAFNEGRGIAVGGKGVIFESDDAGKTWEKVEKSPSELAFLSVASRGKHTVAVGQTGVVAVSTGPGQWELGDSGSSSRLMVVDVNVSGLALAAGEFGAVIQSSDGGRSWTPSGPDWSSLAIENHFGTGEPSLYGAWVSDSGQMTLAGEYGLIVRSDDAGVTWRVIRAMNPKASTLHALYLDERGNSFAVGQEGELLISSDGGETWVLQKVETDLNFLGVTANQEGVVVITGMRVMYRSLDGGQSWTSVREGDTTSDWYQAVRAETKSGKIFAVGHSGKIIRIGS